MGDSCQVCPLCVGGTQPPTQSYACKADPWYICGSGVSGFLVVGHTLSGTVLENREGIHGPICWLLPSLLHSFPNV